MTRKRSNYTPYNHFSKPTVEEPVSSGVDESPKEEIMEETPIVEKKKTGTVANCSTVNVRVKPDITSPIASVILKGETVSIDEKNSTSEFFAVVTSHGIEGFIVKNYIKVNE